MSVFVESDIEFDFTKATSVIEHDKISGHGNSHWPGIDFCVEDAAGWIWLEVKSWDAGRFPASRRGGQRWSFISKMRSSSYTKELRVKFLGTTAYLAWTGQFTPAPTSFILLFEPPAPIDAALLVTQSHRIRSLIPNLSKWSHPIAAVVLPLAEWNARFPDYPARKVT